MSNMKTFRLSRWWNFLKYSSVAKNWIKSNISNLQIFRKLEFHSSKDAWHLGDMHSMTAFSVKRLHGIPIELKLVMKGVALRRYASCDCVQLETAPRNPKQAEISEKTRGV